MELWGRILPHNSILPATAVSCRQNASPVSHNPNDGYAATDLAGQFVVGHRAQQSSLLLNPSGIGPTIRFCP